MTVRVLFTSTPGTGHIHPMVPIAAEMQRRGDAVLWVTPQDAVDRVASYGFAARAAGVPLAERTRRFFSTPRLEGIPPHARRPIFFSGFFAEISAPAMRDELGPIVDEFRPDLIVHEFAELGAAPVASARGIPHVTVAFSGAATPELLTPARVELAPVWAAEGLEVPADLGLFEHLYLHPWPSALGGRPDAATVCDSRHMGYDGDLGELPAWVAALGRDRPCVYVTFGTEMGPIAPWEPIIDALGRLDVDAVVTTGSDVDLSACEPLPANVRIERYVPQRFVLDRASLVVSHCGAGTLAAALERGLPQVTLPMGADQFDNASACAAAGVAMDVSPPQRSADDIASAMHHALTDTTMRARCAEVRDQVSAMPSAAETVTRIAALIR